MPTGSVMQNIIYLTQANYTAQGWRSLVKRDGLKIRWLRSTGVQNNSIMDKSPSLHTFAEAVVTEIKFKVL